MKKLFIVIVSVVALIIIMFLPGCGGGNSGDPGGNDVKVLKVYQTSGSGGVVKMSLDRGYGVIVAAGLLEIGDNYVLNIGGDIPIVESYVQNGTNSDGTPIIVKTKVELSKDFSEAGYNDCFNFNSLTYQADGKTTVQVSPTVPGKCKLVSIGDGLTKTIEVLVFDGIVTEPAPTSGYIITNTGHSLSGVKSDCGIFSDNLGNIILPGKSYKFNTGDQLDWRGKMKNMTAVDVDAVNAGATDRIINAGDMCVSAVPGGYIKICWIQGVGIVWEFTSTTSFR